MFCSSCGAKVADTARFCPICGAALAAPDVPSAAPSAPASGASPAPDAGFAAPAQPVAQVSGSPAAAVPGQGFAPQVPAQQAPAQQAPVAYPQTPIVGVPYPAAAAEPPMKWYKFVIWVQLFLNALLLAVTTFQLAQGAFTFVSGVFPSFAAAYGYVPREWVLFTVFNAVFAVLFCALAVMCIVVRQELAAFRRVGPMHYYVLMGAIIGVQFLYIVIQSLMMGTLLTNPASFSGLFFAVAMIFINKAYFDKRMHLFIN